MQFFIIQKSGELTYNSNLSTQITSFQTQITSLQTQITNLTNSNLLNANLQAQIDTINNNNVSLIFQADYQAGWINNASYPYYIPQSTWKQICYLHTPQILAMHNSQIYSADSMFYGTMPAGTYKISMTVTLNNDGTRDFGDGIKFFTSTTNQTTIALMEPIEPSYRQNPPDPYGNRIVSSNFNYYNASIFNFAFGVYSDYTGFSGTMMTFKNIDFSIVKI